MAIVIFFFNKDGVEKKLIVNISSKISTLLKSSVKISDVEFKYNGDLVINSLSILDHKSDTLIYIDRIVTSILTPTNILTSNTKLNSLYLSNGVIKINKHPGDSLTNYQIFFNKIKRDNSQNIENFSLNLKDLNFKNFRIELLDNEKKVNQLTDFKLNISDFLYSSSKIDLKINNISYVDLYGFDLLEFESEISYNQSRLNITDFSIQSSNSFIKGDLKLSNINEDSYINSLIVVDLLDSQVSTNDLKLYYNSIVPNELLTFNSSLKGSLDSLLTGSLDFKFGSNTTAKIKFSISDLLKDIKVNTVLEEFYTNYDDLIKFPYISNFNLPEFLNSAEFISITGLCDYSNNLLNNKYVVNTNFGRIYVDLNLMDFLDTSKESSLYGTIKLNDFIFNNFSLFNANIRTSADFILDGSVLSNMILNTSLSGVIKELYVDDALFSNILINGTTNNDVFTAKISSENKDLNFDLNSIIDYSENIKNLNIKLDIMNFDLGSQNYFNGGLNLNIKGSNIKDLIGDVHFTDSYYNNKEKTYFIENFRLSSLFKNGKRIFNVNSPELLTGFIEGDFDIKKLSNYFEESIKYNIYENDFSFVNDSKLSTIFEFDIHNDFINILYPNLTFGKNTLINGVIDEDPANFKLNISSPTIQLNSFTANNVSITVDNSKEVDNFNFQADNIILSDNNTLKYLHIKKSIINDSTIVKLDFKNNNQYSDELQADVYYSSVNQKLKFGLINSFIKYRDKDWSLSLDSTSTFDANNYSLEFNKVKIFNNSEKIFIDVKYVKNSYSQLKLLFDNLSLENLPLKSNKFKLTGNIDGEFIYDSESNAESKLIVDNIYLNNHKFGVLDISLNYDSVLKKHNVESTLKNNLKETMNSYGFLFYDGNNTSINIITNFNKFPINSLNIIGKNNVNKIRGDVSGFFKIKNNLFSPNITGSLVVNNSGLTVPYTKVDYRFANNSVVKLTDTEFTFDNIAVDESKYNSKGLLNGKVSHNKFKDWFLDLQISSDRLLVLDTEDINNPVYYGTAFVSGDIMINGPGERLSFDANISSEKGTVFNIPLNDSKNFTENISYIKFVSSTDKTNNEKDYKFNNIKGIELDFNLNINENAEIEILIDKTTGSTIRGYGNGNLIMEINNKGKFNMFGDFVVDNGKYNFVYAGILKKEFDLKSGGSLSWNGDPMKAFINLETSYSKIEANPSILLDNPVNLSIPVNVNVNLIGELLNPSPEFKLEFPNVDSSINNELQYRLNDKESNQFQALSLLATGSFQNDINFNQQALFGNLAESAASIINNILFDENDKLKFGLDYQIGENTPNYQSNDEFGVTLSTRLSENILINGKLGVPIGGVSETVIAGDFEIELKLNSDRTLTMKIFNRENTIRNFGEQIGYTQGVGVSYNVEFTDFKKLIKKLFK